MAQRGDFIRVSLTTFPLASQVVYSPVCLPFSKYPDRIFVPPFRHHSQNPVSVMEGIGFGFDASILVTVNALYRIGNHSTPLPLTPYCCY
jgi:hypothetical protein